MTMLPPRASSPISRLLTTSFPLLFLLCFFDNPVTSLARQNPESILQIQGKARVLDGDTLEVDGHKVRLHGIDAPETAQKCYRNTGEIWRCGKAAKKLMLQMTLGYDVRCKLFEKDDFKRWIGTCFVEEINLNEQMVLKGLAWAFRKYSTDFVLEEAEAKVKEIGIWDGKNEPAWVYRAKKWLVAEKQVAPNGCAIKGNISRRNRRELRIYHMPWFRSYKRTSINEKKGERWFCSEKEALAAGWRRAYAR